MWKQKTLICTISTLVVNVMSVPRSAQASDNVFVANENIPDAVREIDPVANSFVRSYDQPAWSSGGAGRYLAFDGQGHLWVTDNGSSSIYELGPGGILLNSYSVNAPYNMNDIEYSPANDRLYLSVHTGPSGTAQELIEINPHNGSQVTRLSWGSEFESNYIGFAPDGNLYVTTWDGGPDVARVYDPVTFNLIRAIAAPPQGRVLFSGIAFVGNSFYLATLQRGGGSAWINEYLIADGSWQRTVATFNGLSGLQAASANSLWAVVGGPAEIQEVDIATGAVLRTLDQGGLSGGGNQDIEIGRLSLTWYSVQITYCGGSSSGLVIDHADHPQAVWGYPNPSSAATHLRYVRWTGLDWIYGEIPITGPVLFADIAVASDNTPRVVWADEGIQSIRYTAGDSNGSIWNTETIETFGSWWKGGMVPHISLGSNDVPQVSYFYAPSEDARHAIRGGGGSWTITTVDSSGRVGKGSDIVVDASGYAHMIYFHQDLSALKYATNSGGSWITETIHLGGSAGSQIKLDSNGVPHVMFVEEVSNVPTYGWYANRVGGSWSVTATPHVVSNMLAIDSLGNVHTLALEGTTLWHDTYDGVSWTSEPLPSSFDGMEPLRMDIDSAGNLYALTRPKPSVILSDRVGGFQRVSKKHSKCPCFCV